jgi:exosome complex component RRP41
MSYSKRIDGRGFLDLRPIEAKAGIIKNAEGSACFKIGNTTAYAAVYGPRELHPKFLQDPGKGVLRCNYNMMPFSGMGERVRPGPSRRSKEISLVTEKALRPVVDLSEFPNSVVDVYIELTETDAGSRCAGICAASLALADAGIPMRDLVAAVSVGQIGNQLLIDLNYQEEAYEDADVSDIPVAYIPSIDGFSLLQMDGITSKELLLKGLELVKEPCKRIIEIQRRALKEKYKVNGE